MAPMNERQVLLDTFVAKVKQTEPLLGRWRVGLVCQATISSFNVLLPSAVGT